MNLKQYEEPCMDIELFDDEDDVITSSPQVEIDDNGDTNEDVTVPGL